MKAIPVIFFLLPGLLLASTTVPSHCNNTEKVIFNCKIKESHKTLSLCASQNFQASDSYLQYRFGKIGKIELEYPENKNNSLSKFLFNHYFRYQADYSTLKFKRGSYEYTIFDNANGEDNPDKPLVEQGISVGEVSLLCASPVTSELLSLEKIISCDKDSDLGC